MNDESDASFGTDSAQGPSQPKMGFGTRIAADLKMPHDVPKAERLGVIRCAQRHKMGYVTKYELVLFTGMPSALSSKDDAFAACDRCPSTEPMYLIHMDLLRAMVEHWPHRMIDILITDIATVKLDRRSPNL